MKIIDLSHTIHSKMPVFPGTEQPKFEKANTLENDGFVESKITMYSHTGTHMDAPAHMLKEGPYLDDFSVDHFIGNGIIVDLTNIKSENINIEDLLKYEKIIENVDYIILKTGWSKYWGSNSYFKNFPVLTNDAAKWLLKFKLKGIGIDAISIDHIESEKFPIHHIFFKKGLVIIENLTNLDSIDKGVFLFSCMPLKNKDADGSPIRAIAIIN